MAPESKDYKKLAQKTDFNSPEALSHRERIVLESLADDSAENMLNPKAFMQSKGLIDEKGNLTESGKGQKKMEFINKLTEEVAGYISRRGFLISKDKRSKRENNVALGYQKLLLERNKLDPFTADQIQSLIELVAKHSAMAVIGTTLSQLEKSLRDAEIAKKAKEDQSKAEKLKADEIAKAKIEQDDKKLIKKAEVKTIAEKSTTTTDSKSINELTYSKEKPKTEVGTAPKPATYYVNVNSRLNTRTMADGKIGNPTTTKLTKNQKVEIDLNSKLDHTINGTEYDYVKIIKINEQDIKEQLWVATKYLGDSESKSGSAIATSKVNNLSGAATGEKGVSGTGGDVVDGKTKVGSGDIFESNNSSKSDLPSAELNVGESDINKFQNSVLEAVRSTKLKNINKKYFKFEYTKNGLGGTTFEVGTLGYNLSIASDGNKNYLRINDKNGTNINKFPIVFNTPQKAANIAESMYKILSKHGGKLSYSDPVELSLTPSKDSYVLRFDSKYRLGGEQTLVYKRSTYDQSKNKPNLPLQELAEYHLSDIKKVQNRMNNLKKPGTNQSIRTN